MRNLLLIIVLAIVGCSSPDVLVRDSAGDPIENAEVAAQAMSTEGQPSLTNARGEASVSWQAGAKFVIAKKSGYRTTQIPIEGAKPIVVVMEKG